MLKLPVLDLKNDSPDVQARIIREALNSIGFFVVQNSDLDAANIDSIFGLAKELFDQPQDVKAAFPADENGSGYYKPHEQALGLYKRDNKEAFLYGRKTAHRPQPLPAPFTPGSAAETTLKNFYRDCHSTSERLLELFALALELPFAHFRRAHSFGDNTATSLIHYPPISHEERKMVTTDIRSGEHKDWGTLTMLFQKADGQPGLQVYLPRACVPDTPPIDTDHNSEYTFTGDWGWYDAPIPPRGSFLINVGLAMELWSGGVYKATLHRVVFPPPRDGEGLEGRFSVTYFVQPDDDVEIRPVLKSGGGIVKEGQPITSKDLFGGKLKESLERIKNMPQAVA